MYTFLGVIRCEFTNKDTGEQITGWHIWLAEPAQAPSSGLCPVKKWFTDDSIVPILKDVGGIAGAGKYAGCEVEILLGLRGQIMGIKFPVQK